MVWQSEMTLLNNRFFLGDFLKWFSLTLLICLAFFVPLFGIPGGADGVWAALLIVGIGACLLVVSTLLFAAIMGNRVPMEFQIGEGGVAMRSVSKRVKGINRLTMILGLLSGKPGAVGAGAIGASQENSSIPWDELRKVHCYPDQRVIFLKGGILSRIRLYCSAENYEAVEKKVREMALQQGAVQIRTS